MKFFFPACVACGLALSVLAVFLATRHSPLSKLSESPPATVVVVQRVETDLESRKNVNKLMEDLQNELAAIRRKEADLDGREKNLQERQVTLETLKDDLKKLQGKLEAATIRTAQGEQANLKRLAEVYGKMEPDGVATLLGKMEMDRAAAILRMLNERQAGAVLAAAVASGTNGARNAACWSDSIRRMAVEQPARK
ncbi:MAG: hypothetical protein WCR06_02315 [bacterium]